MLDDRREEVSQQEHDEEVAGPHVGRVHEAPEGDLAHDQRDRTVSLIHAWPVVEQQQNAARHLNEQQH